MVQGMALQALKICSFANVGFKVQAFRFRVRAFRCKV